MREIPLTKGYVTIVDDADYELASQFKWHAEENGRTVYAKRNTPRIDGKQTTVKLHRFLMGVTDPDVEVDHQDHNGLNNRRGNLRVAVRLENTKNRTKNRKGSSSYKGVSWWSHKGYSGWEAQIQSDHKKHHLGIFQSEVEAAFAYDEAARRLHGAFAQTNFAKAA